MSSTPQSEQDILVLYIDVLSHTSTEFALQHLKKGVTFCKNLFPSFRGPHLLSGSKRTPVESLPRMERERNKRIKG